MPLDYLHNHSDFENLLNIIEDETGILAQLVEKDYWIMHVLHGLKKQGFDFELKGGTSLSKGYKIIDRFSEDIDIHIKSPEGMNVEENPKKIKPQHIQSRKNYYDWLANNIKIDGIVSIERDHAFDDLTSYRSGGIRLMYNSKTGSIEGMKEGILLEAGFDTVTPNDSITISSWAFDKAASFENVEVLDNKAVDIVCYHPGYTFVEKLQTIATKYRQEQEDKRKSSNFMRQYYDVYNLLNNAIVQKFIGTPEYIAHKERRFPKADLNIPISENEAFLLTNSEIRSQFRKRYEATYALYYNGQPDFDTLLDKLRLYLDKL